MSYALIVTIMMLCFMKCNVEMFGNKIGTIDNKTPFEIFFGAIV